MINGMDFLGKWTFSQSGKYVQLDTATSALKVAAQPSDGSERFNAYGTNSVFILQASNGLFVVASGTEYKASAESSGTLNQYAVETAGANVRVKDLGVNGQGPQFYWNNVSDKIVQAPVTNPPASTEFLQTLVTPGLESILKSGLPPSPDLRWVNLAGVNFDLAETILDFNQSNLSNADFSNCRFPIQTGFDHCTGEKVKFLKAILTSALFSGAILNRSDFTGATLNGADFSDAKVNDAFMADVKIRQTNNLAGASFQRTHLERADFTGAFNILNIDFTGAFLNDAVFTRSSVTGPMILDDANCSGAAINNPDQVTIFPKMIKLNAKTNFTGAKLQKIDFSDYDLSNVIFSRAVMSGCKFDRANLTNSDFGYANVDNATFTGGISMHGANFSSASMQGADLTGAQMGALSQLFRVPESSSDFNTFLNALKNGDGAGVQTIFVNNSQPLLMPVTVLAAPFAPPNTHWIVDVTKPAPNTYTVLLEKVGDAQSLGAYQSTTPCVLANAFMVNVTLTSANLYAVRASGVQLYSTAGRKVNLNRAKLNGFQANNGNLGNIDLTQADLPGVNFDYAILTGARFDGATILVDANGGQTSFNGANLQGANFTSATIINAVFSNAAASVASPLDDRTFAGVWQFSLSAQDTQYIVAELNAASNDPLAKPTDPKHQFTLKPNLLPFLNTPGAVPLQLINAFKQSGNINLPASAVLTIFTQSVYWLVTDGATNYVIFEACNQDSQPALGVAAGTDFTTTALFFLPLSLQSQLVSGKVSPILAEAFKLAGHPLGSNAFLSPQQHPTSWAVIDTPTIYNMWLSVQATLTSCGSVITVRPSIGNTINAFANVSLALSQRATVTRIKPTTGWKINNDADNPFNPVKNYIEFQAFANSGGGLDVYGSIMRIIRMKGPDQQQFFNIPSAKTVISETQLSPGTICPNGNSVATNQQNQIPFDLWMRARFLPTPPLCVPDPSGNFSCPI